MTLGFQFAFSVLALLPLAAQGEPKSAPEPKDKIELWVKQLGSPRFAERVEAARCLAATESARPFVVPLLVSADLEVAERARWIVAEHARRFSPPLERYFRYGRQGEIERMTEGLAHWGGPVETEKLWRTFLHIATLLRDRSPQETPSSPQFASTRWDFYCSKEKIEPTYVRLESSMAEVRYHSHWFVLSPASEIKLSPLYESLVIAAAPVRHGYSVNHSIIFNNGNFSPNDPTRRFGAIRRTIIVSSGSVSFGKDMDIDGTLVIAKGPIDLSMCRSVSHCHFISSDKIILPDHFVYRTDSRKTKPLDFVQWFRPGHVGLEVDAKSDAAVIRKVHEKSVAALAGIKPGDIIKRIDGAPFSSPEDFRKRLLRGSVQNMCVLSVDRSGAALSLTLDFRQESE